MKEGLKKVWHFVKYSTWLKYAAVAVFAVVFIGFVDENSVWSHFRNEQTINSLQDEIDAYNAEHQRNQARIREIDRDPKAIEKIARERYFMKTDDEDIFVFSEDLPEKDEEVERHETAD
ncbi:MAG: septum formation initiator family protein [Prevotella sp.]|jgi:cell division protein FtsB|nr:septum formation initiator family protein [Prevotella sp.]